MRKENISSDEKGRKSFRMAKAIQDAMFDGCLGKLIDFDKIDTETLTELVRSAQSVLDWRDAPNYERTSIH